jgi:hypothetical protein
MSGNNDLGDATTGDGYAARTVEANESITAGDFVALDQSAGDNNVPQIVQLNNGNTSEDQLAGVATEDFSNGDTGTVQTAGWVVGNVATGISMGERLGSGGTAGRAASEDGGHALAWSNEGGTDQTGTNLSGNEAEVYLG